MGAAALTAFLSSYDYCPPSGVIVTAVLPGGCTLDCPFCFVNQRDERSETSTLTPRHLTGLLDSVSRAGVLGGAAIVGDEPLQPKAWPYTQAFLARATKAKVPTALITNGYDLERYVLDLEQFDNLKILVSLDAIGPGHDLIRRREGAFTRIQAGIEAVMHSQILRDGLIIATTLMPQNRQTICDIIDFAAERSVKQVIVSPLLVTGRSTQLRVHPKIIRDLPSTATALLQRARSSGVALKFADEFGVLGDWTDALRATGIAVATPKTPARLIRADASGRIETLDTIRNGTSMNLKLPDDVEAIDAFVAGLLNPLSSEAMIAA